MFTKPINLLLYPLFREFKTTFFCIKRSNVQVDKNYDFKTKILECQLENGIKTKKSSGLVFCISCLLIYFLIMLELEIQTCFDLSSKNKKKVQNIAGQR